jgi:cyclic beta-1,2-glucan synthetase
VAKARIFLVRNHRLDTGLNGIPPRESEEPLRGELLSPERLEQRARELAADETLGLIGAPHRPLRARLAENARALEAMYRTFGQAPAADRLAVPAAQWLLDNFHLVLDQIREVREDLPDGFERELPRLAAGPLAGYPRVYRLAIDLIVHTDSRLDAENLRRFVRAYQRDVPLSMGELWALPIMLRVNLVENLRRLAEHALTAHQEQQAASALIQRLLAEAEQPTDLVLHLAEAIRRESALAPGYAVYLIDGLRAQQAAFTLARQWLEERLTEQGMTPEQLVRAETQRQTADQASVGNVITSMRLMATLDWSAFFEEVSLVDALLRDEPGGAYASMDFATRDRYRHAIEDLARRGTASEIEATRQALALAAATNTDGDQPSPEAHVGYYLIDDGRPALERRLGYRPRPSTILYRFVTAASASAWRVASISLAVPRRARSSMAWR